MTFAIRTAVPSDVEALRGLFRRASLSNEGDRLHLLSHPESLVFSDDAVRQGRTRVAVESEGDIVGFASWVVNDNAIELEDLFVEPQWMRRGVGRALVLDAVAIARTRSFDTLEVTANPHAQEFYEDVGFVVDYAVETDFYPGQRMHRDVR
ncbi:MAG: GNAT family N-acetyltransferase [Acidimicrobiales bacterium]|nr:GNAT family N-acetyltransferase [Acidimicrobiales bacterium]